MKNIVLIGAGGHCKSCIDVIELEKRFKVVGLIDNKKNRILKKYKLLGNEKNFKKILKKNKFALITLGQIQDLYKREKLFNLAKKMDLNFQYNFTFSLCI